MKAVVQRVSRASVQVEGQVQYGNLGVRFRWGTAPTATVVKDLTWFDRIGDAHTVSVAFTKTDTNDWTYSVGVPAAHGAWTGTAHAGTGGTTGTLVFSDTFAGGGGTLTAINGAAPSTFTIVVDDETVDQTVTLDFTALNSVPALRQVTDGSGTTTLALDTGNGTSTVPGITEFATYTAHLDSDAGVGATNTIGFNWFDRDGAAHTVSLTLYKAVNATGSPNARDDEWAYTLTSPVQGVWTAGFTTSGTLTFDTAGNLASPLSIAPVIFDGTFGGQTVAINFSAIKNDAGVLAAPSGSQDGSNVPPDRTSAASYQGNLDPEELVGFSTTSFTRTWYDRLGFGHSVDVTFSKLDTDQWMYSFNGLQNATGVWDGTAPGGSVTGTLAFSPTTPGVDGTLTAINGATPSTFTITVRDDSVEDQVLTINLLNLEQSTDASVDQSAITETDDDKVYSPSDHVVFGSRVVSGQGPTSFSISPIVSSLGGSTASYSISGVQLNFYQVGDSNQWDYNLYVPVGQGVSTVENGRGRVTFNDAGNIDLSESSFAATLKNAATGAEQRVVFVLSALQMGRESDLGGTRSDGVGVTREGINAEIYYSGDGGAEPIMVLDDIGRGARTANLGGISFTVNQASTQDVGLTSYVKAYAFVSATTEDNSMSFQVGADEADLTRLGLMKLDVGELFRLQATGAGQYDFNSIDLSTTLRAQDLMGQVDDALDIVGGENLKVGQFQNAFTRLLDLQRQNRTSMASALSNINDTDMAVEASAQSRRMILMQSATAMVAQANSQGQFLLQLLR